MQERLRENVAKTKELRLLTEVRKLEDALRSKLGDSPMAQKEINRLVEENTANLERQIDLTMKFEKVQLAVNLQYKYYKQNLIIYHKIF